MWTWNYSLLERSYIAIADFSDFLRKIKFNTKKKCRSRAMRTADGIATDTRGVASDENERRRFPFTASHKRAVLLPPCRARGTRRASLLRETRGARADRINSPPGWNVIKRRRAYIEWPWNCAKRSNACNGRWILVVTTEQCREKITLRDKIQASKAFYGLIFIQKIISRVRNKIYVISYYSRMHFMRINTCRIYTILKYCSVFFKKNLREIYWIFFTMCHPNVMYITFPYL